MSSVTSVRPVAGGGRRFWRWFWAVVFALVLVFYTAGGWYFSNQLVDEGFAIPAPTTTYDVEVVSTGPNQITLRSVGGSNPTLSRDGVFGLASKDGYSQVGHVVSEQADGSVTRVLLNGTPPGSGSLVAIEGYAYPGDPLQAFGIPFQTIAYDSPLGPMDAWMIRGSSTTWVVHVHGKGAELREALRLVKPLDEAGFPQLVISYRNDPGQPQDPRHVYEYGRTEWQDLQGAVQYAVDHGAKQVVLVGYSTGAAIALSYMFHAQPGPVVAAVFDAPNLNLGATVDFGASQRDLPLVPVRIPGSLVAVAKLFTAARLSVNWDAIDYVRRAGQVIVPVLVFHGTDDLSVPIETSRTFAASRPELVTLDEVPGAGHVQSWNVDPQAYDQKVLSFLDGVLSS